MAHKGQNIGNKNALGAKGGGRPTLKDELWHKEKWEQESQISVLEAKIASGVFSLRDRALYEALKGNKDILKKFMDKCLADLHEHTGADGTPLFLPATVLEKNDLHDRVPQSPGGDSKGHA